VDPRVRRWLVPIVLVALVVIVVVGQLIKR
jgi:hypothetical protein